jgi:2-succinyl-6-hydroxy-2,4-cyclohexadiene-1-carboxylate synthase
MESALSYEYFMNSLEETVDGYGMMFSPQAMAANIAYYKDWFDLLPSIRCPALLIKAKGEGAVPREDFLRMRSALRRCTAHEMSADDHNVHLSDTAEFYGYMDSFLASLGRA